MIKFIARAADGLLAAVAPKAKAEAACIFLGWETNTYNGVCRKRPHYDNCPPGAWRPC
ncbi:hypothetical protein [Bailinhaonella thermotolerans]|uniref:hypothetical protein n=1 Tax=Bailinhaonella thermotolerans TaxID=1070861 RepID=UPI00192A359D|nr:hypothetical protein [Bailinhaonella thermotolerans]